MVEPGPVAGPSRAATYTPATMDLPVEVSPEEAHAALAGEGAYLLDVREPWEWAERRIPGAVLIPLVELPGRIAELPGDRDTTSTAGWVSAAAAPSTTCAARAVPGP